jgi:hypothetical protein
MRAIAEVRAWIDVGDAAVVVDAGGEVLRRRRRGDEGPARPALDGGLKKRVRPKRVRRWGVIWGACRQVW